MQGIQTDQISFQKRPAASSPASTDFLDVMADLEVRAEKEKRYKKSHRDGSRHQEKRDNREQRQKGNRSSRYRRKSENSDDGELQNKGTKSARHRQTSNSSDEQYDEPKTIVAKDHLKQFRNKKDQDMALKGTDIGYERDRKNDQFGKIIEMIEQHNRYTMQQPSPRKEYTTQRDDKVCAGKCKYINVHIYTPNIPDGLGDCSCAQCAVTHLV